MFGPKVVPFCSIAKPAKGILHDVLKGYARHSMRGRRRKVDISLLEVAGTESIIHSTHSFITPLLTTVIHSFHS